MHPTTVSTLVRRAGQGLRGCSLSDNRCSSVDTVSDARQAKYETVLRISAAETGVEYQEIRGPRAPSLSTDWAPERRRTAPHFHSLDQRLESLDVGGGPSRNRTGVQGFAVLCVTTPPSGRAEPGRWSGGLNLSTASPAPDRRPSIRLFYRRMPALLGLPGRARYARPCKASVLLAYNS